MDQAGSFDDRDLGRIMCEGGYVGAAAASSQSDRQLVSYQYLTLSSTRQLINVGGV